VTYTLVIINKSGLDAVPLFVKTTQQLICDEPNWLCETANFSSSSPTRTETSTLGRHRSHFCRALGQIWFWNFLAGPSINLVATPPHGHSAPPIHAANYKTNRAVNRTTWIFSAPWSSQIARATPRGSPGDPLSSNCVTVTPARHQTYTKKH
jgi:hypothetical protein